MNTEPTLNVTEIQAETARVKGQQYFWRIVTDTGKTVDQFDPVTGKEQQFPNWVEWVAKSPLDPYAGNPAFKGVKRACWIPVVHGEQAFFVDRQKDAHSIILFRKQYVRSSVGSSGRPDSKYTAYCVGQRWEGESCREAVYHICPPTRYLVEVDAIEDLSSQRGILFEGAVSLLTEPLQENEFDNFLVRARTKQ